MSLSPGTRLGPYEVATLIGKGGMGEVYRARDTKLNRDVALKVRPEAFALDPDRLARFKREAQLLASLNHPNIAAIYGLEESDGVQALVLELVEGPTFADRIAQGAIPLDEALPIARQVAEALEAAHDRGIIHRDLKPSNIKLRPDGTVKVLDFGLAKALDPTPSTIDASQSPTVATSAATRMGVILGTAGYMSPEQARGKPVDERADIWAFGVVLYEMLTGRRLFRGDTVTDILAAVIKQQPDLDQVPAKTRPLLRRCLEKDPKRRLRDIGDAWFLLEDAPPETVPASRSRWWTIAAGAFAAIAAGALWLTWHFTRPVDRPLMRFIVDLGPEAIAGQGITVVLSPDGTRMVFPVRRTDGRQILATRLLEQANALPLSGTENAANPFFSPDGQWVGFFADGKLKKISVLGGAAITLCDAPNGRGGSWGVDDNIILAPNTVGGLMRISSAGGMPQPLTKPEAPGERTHRWPQVLPGAAAVLFTAHTQAGNYEDANIEVLSLTTHTRKTLLRGGYYGRYVPSAKGSGHLVYIHEGRMFGVPFDLQRLESRGTPVPVLEDVAADFTAGGGQFDFSGESSAPGALAYLSGRSTSGSLSVVWLDSEGNTTPLLARPSDYSALRFSPDGTRLAYNATGSKGADVWVYDLRRDTAAQLTFTGPGTGALAWTPDGKRVVYMGLWWVRSDGSGEPQRLLETSSATPTAFSSDGRRLAYSQLGASSQDVWTLSLDLSDPDHPKPEKPEPFLTTSAVEVQAAFSPDGRWMAYASNESGTAEVFVRPFPGPGGKWKISTGGGQFPKWSRNGRELFFLGGNDRIMVAEYTAEGDSFNSGKPRLWADKQILRTGTAPPLDLSPDGKRFAVFARPTAEEGKGNLHLTLLLNFFDELQRRAPSN